MPANSISGILAKFVMPVTESGCWIWMGCDGGQGYGAVHFHGRRWLAHRLIYTALVGPISEELDLDHLCRVRCCVNPAHLEPVTRVINIARGDGRKRDQCPWGHPYSGKNLYIKPDGTQMCRQCRREEMRRYNGYQGKPPARERTHCPKGHEYSPENTYYTRDGGRMCRECGRVRHREWWHKRAEKGVA
jgi:hypothetical protein